MLLENQRETVNTQRAIAQRQIYEALPVLDGAQPLVRDLRGAQPWLQAAGLRLDRLARETTPLVTDLRAAVAADSVPEIERMQREALRLQRATVAIQRRSDGIMRRSLAIQRSTEQHAASLDRKTGGCARPAAVTTA